MPFCGFISLQAPVQFQIDKYHLAFQDVTYFIKEHYSAANDNIWYLISRFWRDSILQGLFSRMENTKKGVKFRDDFYSLVLNFAI